MAQLQDLTLSHQGGWLAAALARPSALQRLSVLHTLGLGDPSPLPALAPHLPPSLTRLELPNTAASDLGQHHLQALEALHSLRCLALAPERDRAGELWQAASFEAQQEEALAALRCCLPLGCRVGTGAGQP
ncbi:hypothetical protein ABPG75_010110 [Micractinium tetrahymenae]